MLFYIQENKMMTLYTELSCTYSLDEKNKVIAVLEKNNIPYKIGTNGNVMRNLMSRGIAVDPFGENLSVNCEYRIRVPRSDLERAKYLVDKKCQQ